MERIKTYFPNLTETQQEQFAQLDALYHDWNAKINVISRKDIDNLYLHHVLHSLGIAQVIRFKPGTAVMDLGTGGGFPGIPLAIMFPDTHFHLIDSTRKKIHVCNEVAQALGLKNVTTRWCRAEEEKEKFDFVVSRAVMPLADLVKLCRKNIAKEQHKARANEGNQARLDYRVQPSIGVANALPNGLICLKGGELEHETLPLKSQTLITPLSDYFEEEFFQTKKVVYTTLSH